ncbi:hypothetical protein ACWDA7_13940 [Streptomyces sp. NPDC001156]
MSAITARVNNELVLTESRTMRAQTIECTDVLDKVKTLVTLPDSFHVTTEMVASYYEVPLSTIDTLVSSNFEELTGNGRRVLQGQELTAFATPFGGVANLGLSSKARSLAVFSRKAVLNVGQLLTKSEVARQIRTYLLESEEAASTPRIPTSFAEALELAAVQARELEQVNAVVQELEPKAAVADVISSSLGLSLTEFHSCYFVAVKYRDFFEHLYAADYCRDERGKRWSESKQKWTNGFQHLHPKAKGRPFLYVTGDFIDEKQRRHQQVRVRPGEPELDFVRALVRDGLPLNPAKTIPDLPERRKTRKPKAIEAPTATLQESLEPAEEALIDFDKFRRPVVVGLVAQKIRRGA